MLIDGGLLMVKTFEPYRRAPGTVDAGADFARQLDRFGRDVKSRLKVLETPTKLTFPPYGKVLEVSAPADNATHAVAHGLGYAYTGGLVLGYNGSGARVEILLPVWVVAIEGDDPAVNFYYANQWTTPAGGAPAVNAIDFRVWIF